MNLTCPCCHASFSLEALIQDEAARELLALRAEIGGVWPYLIAYLGCFRSKSRSLAWDRALRLAREVLCVCEDRRVLEAGLRETVEAMRQKREAGDVRPLKNHNYLRRVMEGVIVGSDVPLGQGNRADAGAGGTPKGKRRMALEVLAAWADGDWLRTEIAQGLQALLANPALRDAPAVDMVEYTAGLFETVLRARVNIPEVDRGRVTAAFGELLRRKLERWPEPADVVAELPCRPDRSKLGEPREIGEEKRRQGKEFFRKMAGEA